MAKTEPVLSKDISLEDDGTAVATVRICKPNWKFYSIICDKVRDVNVHKRAFGDGKSISNDERILVESLNTVYRHASSEVASAIKRICEVFLGGKIKMPVDGAFFEPWIIVVPLSNPNGHNYAVNTPCMIVKRNRAVMHDLTIGNNLPDPGRRIIRRATPDEVEQYLGSILPTIASVVGDFRSICKHFEQIGLPGEMIEEIKEINRG